MRSLWDCAARVSAHLAEFVLEMPRGAQVIYLKDLGMILFWADVPGMPRPEAGKARGRSRWLLRAVGPEGHVVTYEQRDEFARRARQYPHADGRGNEPHGCGSDPWKTASATRKQWTESSWICPNPGSSRSGGAGASPGGIFLSYVLTIIQSHQTSEALREDRHWALVETFETLVRPWNIDGQPRVPSTGWWLTIGLTVARRVVPDGGPGTRAAPAPAETDA